MRSRIRSWEWAFRWLEMGRAVVLLALIPAAFASSTQPTFDWLHVAAGRGAETIGALTVDDSGNVYVAGSFSEVLQIEEQLLFSVASSDVFVAKASPTGQILWLATLAGGFSDFSRGIVADGQGGCLVSWGAALSRLTPDGQLSWTRTFPDSLGTFGVVQETPDRAVLLVQETEDQYSLRGVELEAGEDRWSKPIGVKASEAWLARDGGGNLWVGLVGAGEVKVAEHQFRLPAGSEATLLILKFNAEGTLQWVRFAEGAHQMGLNAFKTTASGHMILGGTASGPFTLGGRQIGRTNGVSQGWVLLLDAEGTCRWQHGDQGFEVTAAGPLGTNEVVYSRTVLDLGTQMRRFNLTNEVEWTVFGGAVRVIDLAARTNGSVWIAGRYQGDGGLGTKPFKPPIVGDDGLFFGRRALIKPLVLLDPQSTTNVAGSFVRLQPEIDDADSRVEYQWYKEGKALAGATNATLDFSEVTLADAGGYSVALTNVDGGTNSAVAQLVVVYQLSTETTGLGAVVTDPSGLIFEPGKVVEVLAIPAAGYEFTGWTGEVEGKTPLTNPLRVVMNRNRHLGANFVLLPQVVSLIGSDGTSRFRLVGPAGATAELQASEDLQSWRRVLSLKLSEVPAELENLSPAAARTFYRLQVK